MLDKITMNHKKKITELKQQLEDTKCKYYDLIMSVSIKCPNETRHQTARRYILQAEKSTDNCAKSDNLTKEERMK